MRVIKYQIWNAEQKTVQLTENCELKISICTYKFTQWCIAFIASVWLSAVLLSFFVQQTDTPAMIRTGEFMLATALFKHKTDVHHCRVIMHMWSGCSCKFCILDNHNAKPYCCCLTPGLQGKSRSWSTNQLFLSLVCRLPESPGCKASVFQGVLRCQFCFWNLLNLWTSRWCWWSVFTKSCTANRFWSTE